jgi:hypothetical protein
MAGLGLEDFTANHSGKPWQTGRVDCLLTLADWFVWRGHDDAARHLRGTYDSEDGYRALIDAAGGAVPMVEGCAARIGLVRLDLPRLGAIGVIGSETSSHRQYGAIHDGARWLLRADKGFLPMIARPLAIWDAR